MFLFCFVLPLWKISMFWQLWQWQESIPSVSSTILKCDSKVTAEPPITTKSKHQKVKLCALWWTIPLKWASARSRPCSVAGLNDELQMHTLRVSIGSADEVLCFTTGYLDPPRPPPDLSLFRPPDPLCNPTADHTLGCARSQVCAQLTNLWQPTRITCTFFALWPPCLCQEDKM